LVTYQELTTLVELLIVLVNGPCNFISGVLIIQELLGEDFEDGKVSITNLNTGDACTGSTQ